jgi:DNA-binding response OmpR family regulator
MDKTKILYAEDEVFLGKIVKESLESRGYQVLMETDGNNVFEAFKHVEPDVCVLDIMLPNKDGFAIAEKIRAVNMNVPIIFLTAKTQTADLVKGFSIGGNDYIRKPFSMEELIVRIDHALGSRAQKGIESNQDDGWKMGRYLFHPVRQTLIIANDERKLSFRENELLKMLYQNRDIVIDRKDILNLLWGSDSFFNSRNLDVYINRLRNYLKQDESLEIITIKGIGYRFVTG